MSKGEKYLKLLGLFIQKRIYLNNNWYKYTKLKALKMLSTYNGNILKKSIGFLLEKEFLNTVYRDFI